MAMFRCGVNSNATEPTLLWTNPNPTSAFSAQTISLDLSEYTGVIVEFASGNSEPNNMTSRIYAKKNEEIAAGRTSTSGCTRTVKITDSSVTFSNGVQGTSGTNYVVIPLRIYGVKNDAQIGNSNLETKTTILDCSGGASLISKNISITKDGVIRLIVHQSSWGYGGRVASISVYLNGSPITPYTSYTPGNNYGGCSYAMYKINVHEGNTISISTSGSPNLVYTLVAFYE